MPRDTSIEDDPRGSWFTPQECIKDKKIQEFIVSLDYSPKFESYMPYSITVHELGEGASVYRALFTFRTAADAEVFYNKLNNYVLLLEYLP